MAQISAALVKELREMTDAGMMECKKALVENDGNIEASVDWLRKKGLSKAAKKSDRIASEGSVSIEISDDFKSAIISEINCETDFVSQNENFQEFASKTNTQIAKSGVETTEELIKTDINGTTFEEFMQTQIAKIGENIIVRRFAKVSIDGEGAINGYVHTNGKVGVLVAAKCSDSATSKAVCEVLKDISMHAAAMKPPYLDESSIPEDVIENEKNIAIELLKKEGKPEAMFDKILPGKIKKYYEDNTLINQKFVKDDKKSIKQVVDEAAKSAGGSAEIVEYIRYELGEGIEKKACNFADEVAAQLK